MRFFYCVLIIVLFSKTLFSQVKANSIELYSYFIHDNYGSFDNSYGRSSFSTKLSLKGDSYGISAYYIRALSGKLQARIGLGYYKYSFNKINTYDARTNGGTYPKRPLVYPTTDAIMLYTDGYYYNTITFNIGADRVFALNKGYELLAGGSLQSYYTYSQVFKIPAPQNARYPDYKRKKSEFFGFSANLNIGFNKNFGNFYVGPRILIPVFDQWKQDEIFLEPQNASRNKWFTGFGGGIAAGVRF
ncbi:hypothetical protein [Chitinophaga sp.]|uniref:hypothetical protein n=1 Tax=Chitinophaga sp. TaxID=1869181 RepID=UPI002F955E58